MLGYWPLAATGDLGQVAPGVCGDLVAGSTAAPNLDGAFEFAAPPWQRCQGLEGGLLIQPLLGGRPLGRPERQALQVLIQLQHWWG